MNKMKRLQKILNPGLLVTIVAVGALGYVAYEFFSNGEGFMKGEKTELRSNGTKGELVSETDNARTERRIREEGMRRRASDEERAEEARAARQQRLEDRENSDLVDEIADMIRQELTEEEREYLKKLRAALEANDNKQIVAIARLAARSGNAEVKGRAIDALGWVGADALPELTEFLMDDDEDVVQAAIDKWEEAIRECEDEADIINNTMLGMMAIKDESACDYLSMNLIKSGEASLAVEAIVELMACDNEACHGPAKEAYEWITDNEWTGPDAAKEWIESHPDL